MDWGQPAPLGKYLYQIGKKYLEQFGFRLDTPPPLDNIQIEADFFLRIGSFKLLAAVSLISSRFLELAPDLEHFGYLQQPDSHAYPSLGFLANGT